MLREADFTLFVCVGVLLLLGALLILSSTFSMQARAGESPTLYLMKHLFALFVGLVAMMTLMYTDYNNLRSFAIPIYAFIVLLLFFVLVRGFTIQGAQRWFSLGPISFQPSEIAKLVMIIALAFYLEKRVGKINSLASLLPVAVFVGVPFALIFKQPDLGTSLVVLTISFGMILWAKASPALMLSIFTPVVSIFLFRNFYLWIFYLIALAFVLVSVKLKWYDALIIVLGNITSAYLFPLAYGMLKEYQKLRILAFLNPNIDPRGAGYHSLQAKIAVGSGGFFGKGLFRGTQTQLQFIPEQFSDFIYSAVGEELGFLGAFIVILLFALIIWRAISIASESRTVFGSLMASGIAVMYMFHVLVNIGMTLGMLPVVGIPLPLLSYGGTSLLMNLSAIGILQSISMRRKKLIF